MTEKLIDAVKPFAATLIIFAGAAMSGWVTFSNMKYVGYTVVFFGVLLTIESIVRRIQN